VFFHRIDLLDAEQLLGKFEIQDDDFWAKENIGNHEIVGMERMFAGIEGISLLFCILGDHFKTGSSQRLKGQFYNFVSLCSEHPDILRPEPHGRDDPSVDAIDSHYNHNH
jgi:hypothetical protein